MPPEAQRNEPTLKDLIARGCAVLSGAHVPNPRSDTDLILSTSMGMTREELYCELDLRVDEVSERRFEEMLALRARRCPVSYILGEREFYSLTFNVDPRVLIPRHETELVVEQALAHACRGMRILDVGTGSGCIAGAVATHLPQCEVWASDISEDALAVARENFQRHGLEQRIDLVKADILPVLDHPLDMILSNPPYVAGQMWEELMPEVRGFEPKEALVPGPTGLEFYPRLADAAANALAPGGILIAELGVDQAADVSRILRSRGLIIKEIVRDWRNIPRVVVASLSS